MPTPTQPPYSFAGVEKLAQQVLRDRPSGQGIIDQLARGIIELMHDRDATRSLAADSLRVVRNHRDPRNDETTKGLVHRAASLRIDIPTVIIEDNRIDSSRENRDRVSGLLMESAEERAHDPSGSWTAYEKQPSTSTSNPHHSHQLAAKLVEDVLRDHPENGVIRTLATTLRAFLDVRPDTKEERAEEDDEDEQPLLVRLRDLAAHVLAHDHPKAILASSCPVLAADVAILLNQLNEDADVIEAALTSYQKGTTDNARSNRIERIIERANTWRKP